MSIFDKEAYNSRLKRGVLLVWGLSVCLCLPLASLLRTGYPNINAFFYKKAFWIFYNGLEMRKKWGSSVFLLVNEFVQ